MYILPAEKVSWPEGLMSNSFPAGRENLKIAIAKQDDDKMMHRVNGVDLIAADAKYHPLCRSTYISKGRTQVYEPRFEEEDAYKSAFQSLMKIYDKDISFIIHRAGKAFETSTLLASYTSLLEGKVQNASNLNAGLVNFMVMQLFFSLSLVKISLNLSIVLS